MNTLQKIGVSISSVLALSFSPSVSDSATIIPAQDFVLVSATFDDGGTAIGGFSKYFEVPSSPLPEFYNIQVTTTAGANLAGSIFATSTICYINTKQFACTPNDNLMMSLDTGVIGQPGYDHLQIATYFAPNDLAGQVGTLDPTFSYETACTVTGCLTRHIIAGTIRVGQ